MKKIKTRLPTAIYDRLVYYKLIDDNNTLSLDIQAGIASLIESGLFSTEEIKNLSVGQYAKKYQYFDVTYRKMLGAKVFEDSVDIEVGFTEEEIFEELKKESELHRTNPDAIILFSIINHLQFFDFSLEYIEEILTKNNGREIFKREFFDMEEINKLNIKTVEDEKFFFKGSDLLFDTEELSNGDLYVIQNSDLERRIFKEK